MIRRGIALLLVLAPGCGLAEGDLAARLVQWVSSGEPNFRKSRSVSVVVQPVDLALYRELLPSVFAMPEHPLVSLAVADQLEVGPWPLTPYQLGAVRLRCAHEGREGWHPLTMPENAWVAIWTGRSLGFPKYRADEIRLARDGDGWTGIVRDEGELRLRLEFLPTEVPPEPLWRQLGWDTGGPTFNLRPPREGPEVQVVGGNEEREGRSEVLHGLVRIEIGPERPWAGLVPPGREAPGTLVLWEGGRSLAPED